MKVEIDMKDYTAFAKNRGISGVCYYFRSVFADGHYLAFYSHSPCGGVCDTEKGWVIINQETQEIVDECATRYLGESTGEYRDWIKDMRKIHGKTKKVFRYENGDLIWKMED